MTQETYKKEVIKNSIYKALSQRNRNRKNIKKNIKKNLKKANLLKNERSTDSNNNKVIISKKPLKKVKKKIKIVNNIKIKKNTPKKRSSGCGCGR